MIATPVTVSLEKVLDVRPIALLVREASLYDSQVFIQVENKKINAKSIMGMMSLNLFDGEDVTVLTEGADEQKAADGIIAFLSSL